MRPLVILTGPTAVGKTELSISLAQKINGEIISADSMQVYRGMDIGTAKIKPEEMNGVPHHLIDIINPDEEFNVYKFKELAQKAVNEIHERGRIPIITGGTGFYIQAVLYDIDFAKEEHDNEIRERLQKTADEEGPDKLYGMLLDVDYEYAKTVHANNVKRVIRALEYYYHTGQKFSEHNAIQKQKTSPYNFAYIVLNDDRKLLYERIDSRVDKMIANGLVDEVKHLMTSGYDKSLVSMQGLGYKEIIDYLNGITTLEEAVYIIKRDTRHFAKRQLTWFTREKEVSFVELDKLRQSSEKDLKQAALNRIMKILINRNIIEKGDSNEGFQL